MEEIQGNEGTRLNKFISEAGVASRRASDRLIEDGHVTIDGRKAVLGDKVFPDSVVCVDGKQISREEEDIILAFYKPVGITCTSNPEDKNNVIDYIGYHKRIYSIGRLDKDSEGLLLLTNNGELADGIMRSRAEHEKEYLVEVSKDITPAFLKGMSEGVPIIEGKVTKKCFVEQTGPREFRIILRQGLNRQIRRMCDYFGYDVVRLVRVRIMNITTKGLKEGRHRNISKIERDELYDQLGLKK
ncbi:MAG: pseudouridine synthase [Candidatus Methanogranum gryphiswaldense]|jgi:23S rRNA pseudouridine2604 synthase|nr:MAG: pseudouridine synthase [Candidatus Methanogranum sp. U3.2.1]